MITENYIKMCEKAEEIQKLKKFQSGDWYCEANLTPEVLGDFILIGENTVTKGGYDYDFYEIDWKKFIYLPTQEQLQEMMELPSIYHRVVDKLYDFTEWVKINATYVTSYCSMNELWLAFVMKEKYNKIWNGKVWIKE